MYERSRLASNTALNFQLCVCSEKARIHKHCSDVLLWVDEASSVKNSGKSGGTRLNQQTNKSRPLFDGSLLN